LIITLKMYYCIPLSWFWFACAYRS